MGLDCCELGLVCLIHARNLYANEYIVNASMNRKLTLGYSRTYKTGMGIATRLDRMMKERKVKGQSALSRLSGVPQPTIARVLKGTTDTPELATVKKLAGALGVTATWLAEGPDEPVEYAGETSNQAAASVAGHAEANEFSERATVLREMQIAQATAVLASLPDGALAKALGWLLELRAGAAAETKGAQESAGRHAGTHKQKVIEFTGLHPEPARGRRGAK